MNLPTVDDAYAFLRGHSTGELQFDEHLRKLRYVIAPDGRMVAPAMVAMLECVDPVLFVPECTEEAMQAQVTLERLQDRGPDGALADRWRIYHGEPEDVHWAIIHVDAVKFGGAVIDGEAMLRPNPLAAVEAQLCREMNADHQDDLRALGIHYAKMEIESPVMVGVDPLGIDLRSMFDVVRIPADSPMLDADAARQMLKQQIAQAHEAQQQQAAGDG